MTREPHPDDPRLRATYKDQLVDCLAGIEVSVLERMIDPKEGLVSKLVHPPSIGEVNRWLEAKREPILRRIDLQMEEIKRIEEGDPEVITEEERERNLKMLQDVSALIRTTANAKTRQAQEAMGIQHKQVRDNAGLLAGLKNLDDMRGGS